MFDPRQTYLDDFVLEVAVWLRFFGVGGVRAVPEGAFDALVLRAELATLGSLGVSLGVVVAGAAVYCIRITRLDYKLPLPLFHVPFSSIINPLSFYSPGQFFQLVGSVEPQILIGLAPIMPFMSCVRVLDVVEPPSDLIGSVVVMRVVLSMAHAAIKLYWPEI
jgi:hypothetical protein